MALTYPFSVPRSARSRSGQPPMRVSGNVVVCNYFGVTVCIVRFHPQHKPTEAVNATINCNAVRLKLIIWIQMPQRVGTPAEVLATSERRARRGSTPSGSISLITILIVSWETTYPLWIARRCNHRYPWSRPLVAISDCTKEAISSMSVWFFLLNKLSFLHNRCSVLLLIITQCWCAKRQRNPYC